MSIRAVIEGAGLTLEACARALSVNPDLFSEWADAKREIPPVYADNLSAILGTRVDALNVKGLGSRKVEPSAIWFKFRGEEFSNADREAILLIRRLGHNVNQLERATEGQPNRAWDLLFQNVRAAVDLQDSPQAQGRAAARAFRSLTHFGKGGTGASEYLRGSLRSRGILLIESPIKQSSMEGCAFLVGDSDSQRPCIFVNNFSTTWFRRNVVILHELGHAIFDQSSGVEIDTLTDQDSHHKDSLVETRAEAFARECLLPKNLVLTFCNQTGAQITRLTPASLAALIDFSGVEQKTVVELLCDYGLIDEALQSQYLAYDVWDKLKEINTHALSTVEFVKRIGKEAARPWFNKRATTLSERKLLLPVTYIKAVLEAVRTFKVSIGRASELLMIDRETFELRFADLMMEIAE